MFSSPYDLLAWMFGILAVVIITTLIAFDRVNTKIQRLRERISYLESDVSKLKQASSPTSTRYWNDVLSATSGTVFDYERDYKDGAS